MRSIFIGFLTLFWTLNISSQALDTLVINCGPEGKDAHIASFYPDINCHNCPEFKAMAWTHSGDPGISRCLIAFDFSPVPTGATIVKVLLNLYFDTFEPTYVTHSGENACYLQAITTSWDEYEVTWNNQPAITLEGAVLLPQSQSPVQDYTDIDITQLALQMINDPENNHGLMIRLINENPFNCLLFASGDGPDPALRPKLEVIYESCDLPEVSFTSAADGQTVSFTAYSPTASQWFWDFGDGYFANVKDPVHTYQQQGYFAVCLRAEDECGAAEYCELIDVCDETHADFTHSSSELTVNFQDVSQNASSYFWSFGDGYFSTLRAPWHTYDTAGQYEVCLESLNECSRDTICQPVFVDYSGLDDLSPGAFLIIRNPIIDNIIIRPAIEGWFQTTLYDLAGKEIINERRYFSPGSTEDFPVFSVPSGLYILSLNGDHQSFYKKIIISR